MTDRYRLEGVVQRYREAKTGRVVEALRVAELTVAPGEVLAVVGPNGSGKSTLLEAMAFLRRPAEGRILLDGGEVWGGGDELAARRRCSMLLQKPTLFKATVLHNVMYGLRVRGVGRAEARERAARALRQVGMETLSRRNERELSGGERQRAALARLLALRPEVSLLDEPAAHLDPENERLIEDAIGDLREQTGMTVVLATHDLEQAERLADRIVGLVGGLLMPSRTENVLTGTLSAEQGAYAFCTTGGMVLRFAAEALAEPGAVGSFRNGARVQLVIDPDRVEIVESVGSGAQSATGRVASVERRDGFCWVRVEFARGQQLRARMPFSKYQQLGLNLGALVEVRLGEQAVRLGRLPEG